MSGGQFDCPIVFRGPNASARQVGQPAQPRDGALLRDTCRASRSSRRRSRPTRRACSRRPSATTTPCSSWSPRRSTRVKGEVPDGEHARRARQGADRAPRHGRDAGGVLAHDARRARGGGGAREGGHLGGGRRPAEPAAARRGRRSSRASRRPTAWSWCTRAGPTAASAPRSPTACSASRSTRSTRRSCASRRSTCRCPTARSSSRRACRSPIAWSRRSSACCARGRA